MGTIIVNGKRFAGNSVAVRDGKVVIDGKVHDGELHGDVDVRAADGTSGGAQCFASVTCSGAPGEAAAGATVRAGERAGGGIRAVAFASADNGIRKRRQR